MNLQSQTLSLTLKIKRNTLRTLIKHRKSRKRAQEQSQNALQAELQMADFESFCTATSVGEKPATQ